MTAGLRTKLNHLIDEVECSACGGGRLRDDAAAMRFRDHTIDDLCRMPLGQLQKVVGKWKLTAREKRIAGELLREVTSRVKFLNDVGLEYLTLSRTATTLSGGEAQRIRLASQLGSGLCGVLYVLDEPTIGLHPRDNLRLLKALYRLRDLGNTLVLVEHDREIIAGSDHALRLRSGGRQTWRRDRGPWRVAEVKKRQKSVTGPYLSGKKAIPIPATGGRWIRTAQRCLSRALVITTCRTSTCSFRWAIWSRSPALRVAARARWSMTSSTLRWRPSYIALRRSPGAHDEIMGIEFVNKVIRVDQQPLGNSPTSNPATYTKAFELIRQLFAQLARVETARLHAAAI